MKLLKMIVALLLCSANILLCDPLLVIILMVKNEEPAMRGTLTPFLNAGIQDYLILDTGSTDRTIQATKQLFDEYKVTRGVIEQQPFVDFATSRNYALQCAEQRFPNADFFLMLDAEWLIHNVHELLHFCATQRDDTHNAYLVRIEMSTALSFYTARLIRPRRGMKFFGVVHEVLVEPTYAKVPSTIFFDLKASKESKEKTQKRWLRDRDLLAKEYERNPTDSRTLFYLAQTYEQLDDWQNAGKYYQLRCAMKLGGEEDFMAQYKLAQSYHARGLWQEAVYNYLHAYNLRPSRAEPLIRIADYYLAQKQYDLAFLFAKRACEIPYPHNDILFVEKEHYNFTRYNILGHCAWHANEYAHGLAAVREALKKRPDAQHLVHNLQLYATKNALIPKPRVSIITSVFNGDLFIEGFLHDIVNQSLFNECELIIINANSPGNEEKIIQRYQEQYPNIIYIKLPADPGLYAVWNLAITIASADFITNANIDDRRNPQSLEFQVQVLENSPNIDLVYGDYLVTNTPNISYARAQQCPRVKTLEFKPSHMGYCLPGPQPVWRKSMHYKYGLFSSDFSSYGDHEFWCHAVERGAQFVKIDNLVTGVFYENPQGLSNRPELIQERYNAMQKLVNQYGYLWQ